MKLWHVSQEAGITRFEPRVPPSSDAGVADPVVWAIADSHLVNYLFPRECPRAAIRASKTSAQHDIDTWLGGRSEQVVLFIESAWLTAIENTPLWLHELDPGPFEAEDFNAGYFVSRQSVVPRSLLCVRAPLAELDARGAELRIVPRLRPVAEQLARTSLSFSIIRLRNAR